MWSDRLEIHWTDRPEGRSLIGGPFGIPPTECGLCGLLIERIQNPNLRGLNSKSVYDDHDDIIIDLELEIHWTAVRFVTCDDPRLVSRRPAAFKTSSRPRRRGLPSTKPKGTGGITRLTVQRPPA